MLFTSLSRIRRLPCYVFCSCSCLLRRFVCGSINLIFWPLHTYIQRSEQQQQIQSVGKCKTLFYMPNPFQYNILLICFGQVQYQFFKFPFKDKLISISIFFRMEKDHTYQYQYFLFQKTIL